LLGHESNVISVTHPARFRHGQHALVNRSGARARTIDALQRALETAGVEFTDGDQPGVRVARLATTRLAAPASARKRAAGARKVRRKIAKVAAKKR
jgi:hypothetical protein